MKKILTILSMAICLQLSAADGGRDSRDEQGSDGSELASPIFLDPYGAQFDEDRERF